MNNIKKINPNISEIATGTPGLKINNQYFVSGVGGNFIKNDEEDMETLNAYLDGSLTSIVISDSVTSIGNYAFQNCTSLSSVTIPNSVTSIGIDAFCDCAAIESMTIPGNVTKIGGGAFEKCYNLKSVIIQNGVKSIGDFVFFDCDKLQSITIPSSITSIEGDEVFSHNIKFKTCILGDGFSCDGLNLSCFPALTHDSMVNMFNALATVSGSYTLTLGSTNLAKLTAEEKAIATNKGWTLK